METVVFSVIGAFLLVLIATPLVRQLAIRCNALDVPSERKVHCKVMPRLGGVAIYFGFTAMVLLTQPLNRSLLGLLAGGTLVMLLGIMDDIYGLSPRTKLAGQIGAAAVLIYGGVSVVSITNPLGGSPIVLGNFSWPVTILWVIGVTNAMNLIDGLDGLAAGTSVIAALTMAAVGWNEGHLLPFTLSLLLAGSVLGFLPYNFYPAKIFMGDSGSMYLGFNLAALAVMGLSKGATFISIFVPIVILGLPILDTFLSIVRRYMKHQPIFGADREHLHHRLMGLGLTHRQTVLVIYGVTLILGASAILLTVVTTEQSILILLGLILIMSLGADRLGMLRPTMIRRRHPKTIHR